VYAVKLEIFEGPLDLLLHLVDKNQLDITEIALSSICGEYREYLDNLQKLNLEIESSFLMVFASLLEIKSKSLLPPVPKDEEDGEVSDEHELVKRLREYRLIKEAAVELLSLKERSDRAFPRPGIDRDEPDIELLTGMEAGDILNAYLSVLRRFEESKPASGLQMTRQNISFPFIIRMVNRKISRRYRTSLFELFDSPPDRLRFIVIFLVLLEMARRRKIRLCQEDPLGGITIINCRRCAEGDAGSALSRKAG